MDATEAQLIQCPASAQLHHTLGAHARSFSPVALHSTHSTNYKVANIIDTNCLIQKGLKKRAQFNSEFIVKSFIHTCDKLKIKKRLDYTAMISTIMETN